MLKSWASLQQGFLSPVKFKDDEATQSSTRLRLSMYQDTEHSFTGAVNYIDFEDSENRYLLSGCSDGSINVHDLHNLRGKQKFTAQCVDIVRAKSKHAHAAGVECTTWYPSDNRLFITSGGDKKLKLWDANSLVPMETFISKGRIYHHQCSWHSGSLIAVGSHVSVVELVDLRTGHALHELRGHQASVMALAWSPRDSALLATAGMDSHVMLWDVRSAARPLWNLDWDGAGTAHGGLVNGMAFTPDGLHLVTLGIDRQLRLWESARGRPLLVNYGRVKSGAMRHVQMAVGAGKVFVPSKGLVRMYDLWTGQFVKDLIGHFNRVNCCAYRHVYHELYSGGSDRNILVWKAEAAPTGAWDGDEACEDAWDGDEAYEDAWSSDEA